MMNSYLSGARNKLNTLNLAVILNLAMDIR